MKGKTRTSLKSLQPRRHSPLAARVVHPWFRAGLRRKRFQLVVLSLRRWVALVRVNTL